MPVSDNDLLSASLKSGLFNDADLATYKALARKDRARLIDTVQRYHRIPVDSMVQALAEQLGVRYIAGNELVPDEALLEKIPANIVQRRRIIPVQFKRNGISVLAIDDPSNGTAVEAVRRLLGKKLAVALTDQSSLKSAIIRQYPDAAESMVGPGEEESTAANLFDDVMKTAYCSRATDIHFEPAGYGMPIRMRIDGHLRRYPRLILPKEMDGVINRIKVLAGVDISEQREAQDGGFSYGISDWDMDDIDMRLATIPTSFGERITLRILGQDTAGLRLSDLGMPANILSDLMDAISRPWGMVLVTGPTGSGKSTTLYSSLSELDSDALNILTVEDPIEQELDGISQIAVTSKVSFSQALRSFLRHDPDVLLVGEIRDQETADTAIKAAMTGHMVLSTLHTNDSVSAVTRLVDIGCARFMVSSVLVGVLAQRLVRRLCHKCKVEHLLDAEQASLLEVEPSLTIYKPVGCALCSGSGYAGRIGLYEALWIDEDFAARVADGQSERELRQAANNLYTLWQDARVKVLEGKTSIDEVYHMRPRELV